MEITLEQTIDIITAIASMLLVILLWRTLKQFETTAELSKIQSEYRFRPWVGPTNGIKFISSKDGKHQFNIAIKNFGELPTSNIVVNYIMKHELINKNDIEKKPDHTFDLGPLLPNMEKNYWIFIDSDLIEKAKEGKTKIFTSIYFGYTSLGKKSGYGMISEYIPESNSFVHKDMWVDGAEK